MATVSKPRAVRQITDIGMKRLVCLECGEPFNVPIAAGRPPFYCKRTECAKERLARGTRERQTRRRAREARTRSQRALLDRIWENDRIMLHLDAVLDAAELVGDLMVADKRALQRSIVRFAQSEGVREPRQAALIVAAHAMLLASNYRYSREPVFEEIAVEPEPAAVA